MKILFIAPYVPYKKANHAGGTLMAKHLEELRLHNEVFVFCFEQGDACDEDDMRELFHISNCSKILAATSHLRYPLLFSIRSSKKFFARMCELIDRKEIDAVHIEYSSMAQYAKPLREKYPDIKINVLMHDVTIQGYERMYSDSKGIKKALIKNQRDKVEKSEKEFASYCDNIIALSEKDRRLIEKYYGFSNVKVITPYFNLEGEPVSGGKDICFLGKMDRAENNDAALRLIEIYNNLKPTSAELYIIGANPSDTLKNMETEKIHVTGFVDDPGEYMRKAKIAAFPLDAGAGVKIKVLNAMNLGIPVITTEVGAEGIDEEGNSLVLAQTNEEFIQKIEMLLEDDSLCSEIANKEMKLIKEGFSWEKTQKVFEELYG